MAEYTKAETMPTIPPHVACELQHDLESLYLGMPGVAPYVTANGMAIAGARLLAYDEGMATRLVRAARVLCISDELLAIAEKDNEVRVLADNLGVHAVEVLGDVLTRLTAE